MRISWLAPAALLLAGAPGQAEVQNAPWQSAEALAYLARTVETQAYRPIDPVAAAAKVREAARGLPGMDLPRFDACMVRRAKAARDGAGLGIAAMNAALCTDLGKRQGQSRYDAFRAIADAIAASADPQTAALLRPQLGLYTGEAESGPAASPPSAEPAGIGLTLGNDPGGKVILATMANSPARQAGVETGDVITAIGGAPANAMTLAQAVAALRGAVGSEVSLSVSRSGAAPQGLTLKRRPIADLQRALEARRQGDALVAELRQLDAGLAEQLRAAWAAKGGGATSLVLDLRGNPGGVLDEAVALADLLLTQGEIGTVMARRRSDEQRFNADPAQIAAGAAVVVLTDEMTAAGAEILAAALHDNHRALLLGARTFGRGTVQTLFMVDGDLGVKVTTGEFLRPGGAAFDKLGIEPDCRVDATAPGLIELAIRLAREGPAACPAAHKVVSKPLVG